MSDNQPDHRDICSFCAEIERKTAHNFFHMMIGSHIGDDYLLLETTNFVVMPAIGSLMPGYLLVVPKAHALSFGHLPSEVDSELASLLKTVESRLHSLYGHPAIFFEHGPGSFTERGGSCTDHAHLHVAPIPSAIDLRPGMSSDFLVREIQSLAALHDQAARRIPYLFLRHHNGQMYICDAAHCVSQYLRRDLVHQLGRDGEWDWLVYPGLDHVRATIEAFSSIRPQFDLP